MTYKDRKELPYGMFTTTGGQQVIFGRSYRLLFERTGPGHEHERGAWKPVSEQRRLDLQKDLTIWFYDDATPAELKEEIAADWLRRITAAEKQVATPTENATI